LIMKIFLKRKKRFHKNNQGFIPYESKLFMVFKFKRNFGRDTRNFRTGFTLVELLVVFFIMASILAVVIPGYLEYSTKLDLENLALDVALTIREAQAYGAGARVSSITPNKFDARYGVYFNIDTPNTFIFFEDSAAGNDYRYVSGDKIINTYDIKSGYSIKDLCGSVGGGSYDCKGNNVRILEIFFQRPNPEAIIYVRSAGGAIIGGGAQDFGSIELISPDQKVATTSVSTAGNISIE